MTAEPTPTDEAWVNTPSLGQRASRSQHPSPSQTPSLPHHPHRPHKGWHSRGYLPHFDRPGLVQGITFRLHDSVPREVLERWKLELAWTQDTRDDDPRARALRKLITRYEDAGYGQRWLARHDIATLVQDSLLHFDAERYRLLAWCVMPNHVHVLIETFEGFPLGDVVHSWKSFTAKEANKRLRRRGEFWMADYFDRFIRDERHLAITIRYIEENPVKARVVRRAEEWRYSSAAVRVGRVRVDDDLDRADGIIRPME